MIKKEHLEFAKTEEFRELIKTCPIAIDIETKKILQNQNLSFKARALFC